MDTVNWENTLVEWVNCLNLCIPIQNLADLKESDFFNNIYKILRKTSEIEYDALTFLIEVFNKHYPKCNFASITNVHQSDLSTVEIIELTSLLLHYTCIYDRRNVLTTPLCNNLDEKTQISIRKFLEKLTTQITIDELLNIISDCGLEETKLNTSTPWIIGSSSPLVHRSPLQDILKTPISKPGRMQMKEREISKLKSELEYERFEKADLQEELKVQIEKNKKLDQKLQQKKSEISRLRLEVLSLESRTPPHYQDKDSREIQKQLRGEIQSLEQYIHQCDEEQEVLQKEKDAAKEMVRKLEAQVTMWQEKFLLTENSFETLNEKAREQEIEYNNLKIHCSELEALLEDLRMKPLNESFVDENFQGRPMGLTPSCEDLAHSVVDLQLREVQKQNEDLRNILKDTQDASLKLQSEMDKLSNKLQQTDEKCSLLISDKEGLLLKLTSTETDLEGTKSTLIQSQENIKILNKELEQKSEEFNLLQIKLSDLSELHNNTSKELEAVQLHSSNLAEKNADLEQILAMKNTTIEKMEKEILNSYSLIDELTTKVKQCESEIESLKFKIEDLESQLNFSAENCAKLQVENSELKDQLHNAENTITEKNENIIRLDDALKTTTETIEQLNKTIIKADNSNQTLLIEKTELQNTNELLDSSLQQKNEENTKLQEENVVLSKNITDLQNKIEHQTEINDKTSKDLENSLMQIQSLNTTLETERDQFKISTINFENTITNQNNTIDKLTKDLQNAQTVIDEMKAKIAELESQWNNSKTSCQNLESELAQSKEKLKTAEKEVLDSHAKIDELTAKIKDLESQLNHSADNCAKLQLELTQIGDQLRIADNTIVERNEKVDNLENALMIATQNIEELKESVATLENQNESLLLEKAEQQNVSESLNSNLKQKNEEVEGLQAETLVLSNKVTELQTKIASATEINEKTCKDLENSLNKIQELATTLESEQVSKSKLNKIISDQNNTINKIENDLKNSELVIEQVTLQKIELEGQLSNSKTDYENLNSRFIHLQENLKSAENSIKTKDDALESLEKQLHNLQENLDTSKLENQKLQQSKEELESQIKKMQDNNTTLHSQVHVTEDKLKTAHDTIIINEEQIKTLEVKLHMSSNKISKLEEELKTTTEVKETLVKDLQKLQTELNDNRTTCHNMESQIYELKQNLETAVSSKNEIANKLNTKIEALQEDLTTSLKEVESLQQIKQELGAEIKKVQDVKDKLEKDFEDLSNEKETVVKEMTSVQDLLNTTQKTLNECKHECSEFKKKIADLEDVVNVKDTQLEELQEEAVQLKVENDSLVIKLENVTAQNDTMHVESDKLLKELQEKETTNISKTKELDLLQESCAELRSGMSAKEELVAKISLELKSVQEQRDNLEKDIEQIKIEVKQNQETYSSEVNNLNSTIEGLQQKYVEVEKVLKEKQNENEVLLKTLEEKKLEVSTTLSELQEKHNLIGTNEAEIKQMSALIHITNDSMHKKDLELASLREENSKFLETIDKLTKEVEKLRNIKEELTKSCLEYKENWQIEVEEVKKIQNNLKDISRHLEDEKTSYLEKMAEKDKQIFYLEEEIARLVQQKEALDRDIVDAKDTISSVEKHLETESKLIQEYKNKIKGLEAKILQVYTDLNNEVQVEKDIIDQLHQINEQAFKFREQNVVLNEEIAKEKGNNIILMTKNDALEENLLKLKSVLISTNDELSNIIKTVKEIKKLPSEDVAHLQIALESSEELITDSEKDINSINNYIIELKDYIDLFANSEAEYLDQIETLKEELDEALNKCSDVIQEKREEKLESDSQITDLTSNLHKIIEKYNKLEKDHSDTKTEIADLRQKLEQCQSEIHHKDDLEQELIKLKEQLNEMENLKGEISELKGENETLKEQLGSLEEKRDKLMDEIDAKDKDITVLGQTIINLESIMEQKDLEIGKLQDQLEDMRKHFDFLTKQNDCLNGLLNGTNEQKIKDIEKKEEHYEVLLNEHKNAFDNLKTVNDKLMLDISATRTELHNANLKIRNLSKDKQSLEESVKEKNKLRDELKVCQLNSARQEQAITELKAELDEVHETLMSLRSQKEELEVELEFSRKETEKAKRKRDELYEVQTKLMKETENNISKAHDSAVEVKNDLVRRIETIEKEKQAEREQRKRIEADMLKVREAYGNVISANSTLELENNRLRNTLKDKINEIADYVHIKEAYEKLLEENNKLMTDVDTAKYKRVREKEELRDLVRKEREEAEKRQSEKIREVRLEYEGKLAKMKEKMLMLYRDEVSKEMMKSKSTLQKQIEDLRSQLFDAEQKIHLLETERDMLREREHQRSLRSSRESMTFKNPPPKPLKSAARSTNTLPLERKVKSASTLSIAGRGTTFDNRVTKNGTDSARSSINGLPASIGQNLHMEDEEDDMFNNKYLSDLKEGRGFLTGRESTASRVSTLAMRNSMVPPHLKSSYPAETQFVSPSHFREDDIKTGQVNLDDSLSKLLPGDKHEKRQRKDFGTTSYKKPGPPTPSKNGGRLSLQGNEVHPLKDHNDKSSPKKVTPGRLKALFMGRTSSSLKDNSENVTTPNRGKRRSIFRKPK